LPFWRHTSTAQNPPPPAPDSSDTLRGVASRDFTTRLTRRATRAGLSLNDELVERLSTFYSLLARWNQKINLTALDNPDEAIDRLILEPLAAARYVPAGAMRLMDVGSGGGSPAIPLKLAIPRLGLTMVEVKARKSAFLREAVRQLEIRDADVETARIEELLAKPSLHEAFDVLSMRAVRVETRTLFTLQAFLKSNGRLFLFRGPHGPSVPAVVVPPLEWLDTYPLVESLQSRLTTLVKRQVGFPVNVPRGTSAPSVDRSS
jgi:16S rRNA (guanine527-N7)-methyltransferase